MIHFHDGYLYRTRAVLAWADMQPVESLFDMSREIDAGYCLDAMQEQPAGGTCRIEPAQGEPFAAPLHACGRY